MQLFVNAFRSQLASPLASASLAMLIRAEDAPRLTGLGSGDYYLLTLIAADGSGIETAHEIVKVTANAGGSLSVDRAQEGTTAADWPIGATVEARWTAGAAENMVQHEAGKGLSSNDYSAAEKNKLAGLESSHFKGLHASLAALQAAHPTAVAGDYADVDAGAGTDVKRYLWDVSDNGWKQLGGGTTLTSAQIKTEYESNADTNAFTDAEQLKLSKLSAPSVYEVSSDYTADAATHNGAIIAGDSSGDITITIGADGSPAWTPGASFKVSRLGTGKVKIVGASGVSVRKPASKDAEVGERYGTVTVMRFGPNVWQLAYDLADHVLGYRLTIARKGSSGGGWELDGVTKTPIRSYAYTGSTIKDVRYSADGSKIAFAISNNLFVFDTSTGTQLHTSAYSLGCLALAWSPDGTKLAVGSGEFPRVTMLDTATWAAIDAAAGWNYGIETGEPRSLEFSPDGTKLAIVTTTGLSKLKVINTSTWTEITSAATSSSTPMEAVWSPDGTILAVSGNAAPFLELYNGTSLANKLSAPATMPAGAAQGCAFSPDGTKLAVAHDVAPFITIYNVSGWAKIANPAVTPAYVCTKVAFSPDSAEMAVKELGISGAIFLYNVSDWAVNTSITPSDPNWGDMTYSPLF